MKKVARKKWESDDPAVHKKETPNLENSATFEIIRQEEEVCLDFLNKISSSDVPKSELVRFLDVCP